MEWVILFENRIFNQPLPNTPKEKQTYVCDEQELPKNAPIIVYVLVHFFFFCECKWV
jgi:hypothetical protein